MNNSEPEIMIENNKKYYAYVTMMTDIKYLPGALVFAESLNKLGSLTDIVIMITQNISDDIKELLKRYYTHIIIINTIKSVDIIFNKIHSMRLIEYKKIILIDIDAIILKYPDNLFTLETPAGVQIPANTKIFTDINKKDNYIRWFDNNKDYKNIYSGLLLLEPNLNKYEEILIDINKKRYNSFKDLCNNLDNYYNNITNIESKYVGICSYLDSWDDLYGLQYIGDKPFFYESKFPIEERIERNDNKLWFYYYRLITIKNDDLYFLENKMLKEVNILSKYYLNNISRNIITINRLLKDKINTKTHDKYKTRLNKIFKTTLINKNLEYYYINITREYEILNLLYIQEDLLKNTNINYKIIKKEKNEDLLRKYIITNDKVNIIFMIDNLNSEIDNLNVDIIKKNIIFKKDYKLDSEQLKNILYNVDTTYVYEERFKTFSKNYKDNKIILRLIIFELPVDYKFNFKNDNNLKIFQNIISKLKIVSIFFNDNSLKKVLDNSINFQEKYKNIFENLKYQSLLKWIYNNYTGDKIEKLLVLEHINIEDNNTKYILIDNNKYDNEISIKIILNKKLFFIDFINSNSVLFKNKYKLYKKYINDNMKNIYCIDGINFINL